MHISLFLQPSAVETDSEEYRTHNDTESEIEVAIQVGHYLDFILNSFRRLALVQMNLRVCVYI